MTFLHDHQEERARKEIRSHRKSAPGMRAQNSDQFNWESDTGELDEFANHLTFVPQLITEKLALN